MSQVIIGKNSFGKSPLTVHAWNKDRTLLATSQELGKVQIFSMSNGKVTLQHTLGEHTGRVTGIDWCHSTNQLATCSADRNAFVWVFQDGEWKPTMVLLRVNRACTCIHWSPQGDKFAVGTGSRVIAVCHFEKSNNFWVAKQVKKPIRSTITCLDWHPNNMLIVAGGTDFKVRVFSVFINEVDTKPSEPTNWGPIKPFGAMLAEYDAEGWIYSVAFDKSGSRAVAVSHGSVVTVCSASGSFNTPWAKLPFKDAKWITDSRVVCAGFDFVPEVFSVASDLSVKHEGSLDVLKEVQKAAPARAMDMFAAIDKRGTSAGGGDGDSGGASIRSVHHNTIMQIQHYEGEEKTGAKRVTTCGLDGLVVSWDVQSLTAAVAGMKV